MGCYIKGIENFGDKFKREDMELAALITFMWVIFTANMFNVCLVSLVGNNLLIDDFSYFF